MTMKRQMIFDSVQGFNNNKPPKTGKLKKILLSYIFIRGTSSTEIKNKV